jgi:hypothetical protein
MLFPLIGARLHGWLDELVTLTYLVGAFLLHLHGLVLAVAVAGAGAHFLLTRLTNYPQGTLKLIPFRAHAFIELAEGAAVIAATVGPLGAAPAPARVFLVLLGLSQLAAFSFSDYGAPHLPRAPA